MQVNNIPINKDIDIENIDILFQKHKNLYNKIDNNNSQINNYIDILIKYYKEKKELEFFKNQYLENTYKNLSFKYSKLLFENNFLEKKNILLTDKINNLNVKNLKLIENSRIKFKCKICYNNDINICIKPCNHLAICSSCEINIYENLGNDDFICPICNTISTDNQIVYL